MAKEDHQKRWDKLLIEAWRIDTTMARLIHLYVQAFGIDSRELDEYDTEALFESLGIKRWRNNSSRAFLFKQPVRAFVASHSPHLSACFQCNRTEGNTDADILKAIPAFEWRNQKAYTKKGKPNKKRGPNRISGIRYRAREMDKRHDWDTAK
jgi:hypothetical protein